MRKLISDAPDFGTGAGVVAPLVLQASQRVGVRHPRSRLCSRMWIVPAPMQLDPEPPKPEAPLSHDPEYLEVIANLRRALAGPMRDELSSAVRTMIDDSDP